MTIYEYEQKIKKMSDAELLLELKRVATVPRTAPRYVITCFDIVNAECVKRGVRI